VRVSWHAFVGSPRDGVALALSVFAGARRAVSGSVSVLGAPPEHPETRRAVAYVPRDTCLPDALRVNEVLRLAAALRGEATEASPESPEARLARFGLEALATRAVRSLSQGEARGVALVEAITSKVVSVLLIEEPFVRMDSRVSPELAKALRARAEAGACVVVSTASVRDARDIADELVTFSEGGIVTDFASRSSAVRLRVVADDPRALVVALAKEVDVLSLATRGETVVASGSNESRLAAAIARASVSAGVSVRELRADTSAVVAAAERLP
jgi:ABC-type multidrug transport system ATPase subunit